MKKKKNKLVWVIIVLVIAFGVMIYFYFKPASSTTNASNSSTSSTTQEATVSTQTITKSISSSGGISSAETKNLDLDTSKYFKEIYVEKNDSVKKGAHILRYTDGTYVNAPYNCIISDISVPAAGKICTSSNYVQVQSTDQLYVTLSIGEADIGTVKVGQEAEITLTANNKTYTGKIDKISDVGTYSTSGSTFPAYVKFTNDATVKLGMSASCTVILDKAENAIAVPKEAVQTMNGTNYVVVVNSDGSTQNVTVETGLSNDAYTEIKSGLDVGETVQYTVTTSTNSGMNNFFRGNGGAIQINGGQMQIPSGATNRRQTGN